MKILKIAILVLGPLALAFGVYRTLFASSSPVASSVYVCDVLSGETRRLSLKAVKVFPAPNADGALSLYPVQKEEDGGFAIVPDDRYRDLLRREFASNKQLKVDLATFRVLAPVKD